MILDIHNSSMWHRVFPLSFDGVYQSLSLNSSTISRLFGQPLLFSSPPFLNTINFFYHFSLQIFSVHKLLLTFSFLIQFKNFLGRERERGYSREKFLALSTKNPSGELSMGLARDASPTSIFRS